MMRGLACMMVVLGWGTLAPGEDPRVPERPITAEERAHWAFQPVHRPAVPVVKDPAWTRNPLDAFVLARLEASGLHPAPEASRTTLIRRLSFDLIGLPPSPEEIDRFTNDAAPGAYDRLVDRLLASPQYGVRWAQHWLDLARYADTDGYEFDQARPNAWRYRDWVVHSLNDDMPYDRFLKLQIAGDELAPDDPDAFVATGFSRCYPDMVDLNDQGLRRQNALNDITETTGLVFLGLTLGCARCHDHKFDPLLQADFYRLQAFFSSAQFRDDYPIVATRQRLDHDRAVADWLARLTRIEAAILQIEKPVRDRHAPGLPMGALDEAQTAFGKPEQDRAPGEVRLLHDLLRHDGRITEAQWPRLLGTAAWNTRRQLIRQRDELERNPPPELPTARGIAGEQDPLALTHFLIRGEFTARGPAVDAAFPRVLSDHSSTSTVTRGTTGRRKALAEWLANADHPLTARVMVNRLVQEHFGRGIVGTPSDFGTMGDEPSHPALLDWLASEFVRSGWSLKAMHRLIVLSATYRQSSIGRTPTEDARNTENALLAHQNRRRLDGEAIRDALLVVSGQLNPALNGPGVFPPLPAELTKLSSKGQVWPVSPSAAERNRRSLYVFVRRNLRYPFFEAFDRPDTNVSCPRRPVTTIAPQALSLLNSPLAVDAAQGLSHRAQAEAAKDAASSAADARAAVIERLYVLALGRRPDAAEQELAQTFLASGGSLPDLSLALLNLNEFLYID